MIVYILIAIVISAIIYLGGGWCVYNIYLSCVDIETYTFQEIYNSQILVYDIVAEAGILFFIFLAEKKRNISEPLGYFCIGLPVACWVLFTQILPMSEGAAILNTIFNIIGMTIAATLWLDD